MPANPLESTDGTPVRVAALQLDVAWHDRDANFERVAELLDEAVASGVDLAVLPEMFATGFSMDAERAAADGDAVLAFLTGEAARHGCWVAGSAAVASDAGRPTNDFVAVSPAGEVHRYAKRHPFSLAGEDRAYRAGDELTTFAVGGMNVTPFVCYDLRFGDDFWVCADHTDLYIVVANWPTSRIDHWSILVRARAIENQAFVVGVNRVGEGGGVAYPGRSMIVDPMGTVLAEAGETEGVLVADLDGSLVASTRRALPFLADRAPASPGAPR